jgi:transcriptional regulatory protein LevR
MYMFLTVWVQVCYLQFKCVIDVLLCVHHYRTASSQASMTGA